MNTQTLATEKTQAHNRFGKVFLIDDNSMDNFVNKRLLESTHFASEVVSMENATDAIAYLRSENTTDLPELIFLDINMPGMDGFQFLIEFEKLSKKIHDQCKIIMLSTSESFKDLNRANKNPFVRKFLNKPLTSPVLNAVSIK